MPDHLRPRTRRILSVLFLLALAPEGALAGEVTSKLQGDRLILLGGPEGDELSIDKDQAGGPQDLIITPAAGTTIDGSADPAAFAGVAEIRLFLGNGPSDVTCQDLALTRTLLFQGGGDDDVLSLQGCSFQDDVVASLRQGDDEVELVDCTALSTVRVLGSSGDDSLAVSASDIGVLDARLSAGRSDFQLTTSNFARVTATAGPDISGLTTGFVLLNSTVTGDVKVTFGNLPSQIGITNSDTGGRMRISTGNRDDLLSLVNMSVGEDLKLLPGSGQNNATLTNSSVTDELTYRGGSHADLLSLNNVDAGSLDLRLPGQEQGQLNLDDGLVAGTLDLVCGGASNVINLTGDPLIGDTARISTGGDSDVVNLGTSTFESDLKVFAGPGDDTVNSQLATVLGTLTIDLGPGE